MNEEKPQEALPLKPKQFLLMADELHMALIAKLLPGLLFLEVEGAAVEGNETHLILANPLPQKKSEESLHEILDGNENVLRSPPEG